MGDTFLPFAEDPLGGLFVNPAGIAKIRETTFEALNLGLQMNNDYISAAGINFFKFTSLSSFKQTLLERPNSFSSGQTAIGTGFGFRGFSAGLLFQTRLAATSDGSQIRYKSKYQLIPAAGFGLPLASGVVRLGYSLQWVNQASGDITVPVDSEPLGYNQRLGQGSAFSHNFGFALTLPFAYLPAFNVVARNVGGARFSGGTLISFAQNKNGAPAAEPFSMDASFSIEPKLGSGINSRWAYVLRDATGSSGISILGRSALGLELDFGRKFFVRTGVAGGYPSAGIGFTTPRGDFHLSWFSEETGSGFRSERDIRYMMQFQVRAF